MKPTSRASQNRPSATILEKLFPEGIDKTKIWNGLVVILGREERQPLSIEKLEVVLDRKFKIKRRINKFFPETADKINIIFQSDTAFLHQITQATWAFSESHLVYSRDAIVLHGHEPGEILLDWAAQAVITMLLKHIKVSV